MEQVSSEEKSQDPPRKSLSIVLRQLDSVNMEKIDAVVSLLNLF